MGTSTTTLVKTTDADASTAPKTPVKKPELNVVRDNPISGALKNFHDGLAEVGKDLQKVFTPRKAEAPKTTTSPTTDDASGKDATGDAPTQWARRTPRGPLRRVHTAPAGSPTLRPR